ncbi:MAG: hypothetical protein IRZ13_22030, partial [Acetobacteraceae bacterium]|nr:hypothetical protein [Acetobacteraceae bacterium]
FEGRRPLALLGHEIDAAELATGLEYGLTSEDLGKVVLGDFMRAEPQRRFAAIVANPPYVRHHRFPAAYKAELRAYGRLATGHVLDGRAGLHVFFLIKALTLLAPGGRLAFLVPADTCEGRFAPALWSWIAANFRIEGAVTFAPDASPFPRVDTNPVVLLLRNAPPADALWWARVRRTGTPDLGAWCDCGLGAWDSADLVAVERSVGEAMRTGLTRPPPAAEEEAEDCVPFGRLFRTMRGIATGDNDFFFLDARRIAEFGLPLYLFRRAIGRTRDLTGACLTRRDLDALDRRGRPTYLLSLGRERPEDLPAAVRAYLRKGEALGLPDRPLIAQRSPWYRMEVRPPPPWLFAYLGRRSCRFIRNLAGAVPLTGFLCVYPREGLDLDLDAATAVLNDERTLAKLPLVAKSYGGGALKVEPRNLERLPIPRDALDRHGLVLRQAVLI